jgi:fumarylacetoacetase
MSVRGFGVFDDGAGARVGWREGDRVVDLAAAGFGDVFARPSLNPFLALGRPTWEEALELIDALPGDAPSVALGDSEARLPFEVADYVDFYSSIEHATNLGRLFRPGSEPLLPNWRRLPVGYHGRAGTVVVSGTDVVRPSGQTRPAGDGRPPFGPTQRLDIELELGFVVGTGSRLGDRIAPGAFADHVFGVVLVNDWSARDIQAWEYQPLGPFLGKSFATSISAWVTPLALLEPFRVAGPEQIPAPLAYLAGGDDWALDLDLSVELNGAPISRTRARDVYWTMPQQLAHATVNGASTRTGDLMATGTISGSDPGTFGSLIELTWNGARPLTLADGRERTFLEDGDTVVLRGGAGDLELGEVAGTIVPQ